MKQWRIKNRILFGLTWRLSHPGTGFILHERWQTWTTYSKAAPSRWPSIWHPLCEYGVITGNNSIFTKHCQQHARRTGRALGQYFNRNLEQLAHADPLNADLKASRPRFARWPAVFTAHQRLHTRAHAHLAQNLLISDELSGSFNNKSDAQQKF